MINKKKTLVNINNLNEIDEYKKIGITNFLFPVKDFSIGYNSFELKSIPFDSYLLINRMFDTKGIEAIKKIKSELLKYKGIIFEDLGIYNIFKDENIELIWAQAHFVTNYESINFWNERVSSCVLSNEITRDEIIEILNRTTKPVVFNVMGKNQIMYSRRKLLDNFNKHARLDDVNEVDLIGINTNFKAKENGFGTIIEDSEYFNYIPHLDSFDDSKILYYLILNEDLKVNEIDEIINGKPFGHIGFLDKKTVYKMSEYTDR